MLPEASTVPLRKVDGLEPVFVPLPLHLPHLFAGGADVVLVLPEAGDGILASLQSNGLEGVEPVPVIDLQDEAGQSLELPRPALHGDGWRKPCLEVSSTEMARGSLTFVTDDGLRLIVQRPLLRGGRLGVP